MYVLSWRTASVLTRVLFFFFFSLVDSKLEIHHQNNPRHSSMRTYIIQYILYGILLQADAKLVSVSLMILLVTQIKLKMRTVEIQSLDIRSQKKFAYGFNGIWMKQNHISLNLNYNGNPASEICSCVCFVYNIQLQYGAQNMIHSSPLSAAYMRQRIIVSDSGWSPIWHQAII